MAGYPKNEANEGFRNKQTAMTIFNHPYQHNRSPPYILFLCHSRNGSEAPQKHQWPGRVVCALYYASKHHLPPHVSMYGGRIRKMGLKEGNGGRGRRKGRREQGEIHRSCRRVAGQGLGRSVFVIELETHSPTSTLQTDQTDKYKNISVSRQNGQNQNSLQVFIHVNRPGPY